MISRVREQGEMLDRILFDMESITDMISIDVDSVRDPKLKSLVKQQQREMATSFKSNVKEMKLFVSQDEEGFASSIWNGIKSFFTRIFKFLKSVLLFWKSEDVKDVDEDDLAGIPFKNTEEICKFMYAMNGEFKAFGYTDKQYVKSLEAMTDNILDIFKGKLDLYSIDGMSNLGVDESQIRGYLRTVGNFFGRKKPEHAIKSVGVKKKGDGYVPIHIIFTHIDKKVIFATTESSINLEAYTGDVLDVVVKDKKASRLLLSSFHKFLTATNESEKTIEKIDKTLTMLNKMVDDIQSSPDKIDTFMEPFLTLNDKYGVQEDSAKITKNSPKIFTGFMHGAIKGLVEAVNTLSTIRKFNGKLVEMTETKEFKMKKKLLHVIGAGQLNPDNTTFVITVIQHLDGEKTMSDDDFKKAIERIKNIKVMGKDII